ncbi:MAG: HupE/UreJ family protein [Betaproteobacteria bacterium]|nr:HupE/UreJ family protein [Betaproteobacteria bacterium]
MSVPKRVSFALWLLWLLVVYAGVSFAHEIRPAVATLTLAPEGRYELAIVANMEAVLAGVSPQHRDTDESPNAREYNRLRALAPGELKAAIEKFAGAYLDGVRLELDGARARPRLAAIEVPEVGDVKLSRQTTVRLDGEVPPRTSELTFSYDKRFGAVVLRVREGERIEAIWLKAGEASAPYVPGKGMDKRGTLEVALDYTALGFTHILPKGLDHILFVLGLFLLSTRWKPLLIQVTSFTVAHSITLALAVYGVVSLSPRIVEPLIAASIAYVAIENIVTPQLQPWRPLVVFGFGLLHGLGFAGVLREIGLPRSQFVNALVSFNVGVELGQLAVITLAFLAVGVWGYNRAWYRPRVVIPASAVVAVVGLIWTVERVVAG